MHGEAGDTPFPNDTTGFDTPSRHIFILSCKPDLGRSQVRLYFAVWSCAEPMTFARIQL